MGYVLGMGIVFYIVYTICALIFKHLTGWIVASVLSLAMGIGIAVGTGSPMAIISMIVVATIVWFANPLHIRDSRKNVANQEDKSFDDFDGE